MTLPTLGLLKDGLAFPELNLRLEKRRHDLAHHANGTLVLSGISGNPTRYTPWIYADVPVFQNPLFLYLTGLNQSNCRLIVKRDGEALLFLPPYLEKTVFWDGHYFGFGHAESHAILAKIGFKSVYPSTKFWPILAEVLANKAGPVFSYWGQSAKTETQVIRDQQWQFSRQLRQFLQRHYPRKSLQNLGETAWLSWVRLDEASRQSLAQANRLSSEALAATIPLLRSAVSEGELAGKLRGELQSRSPFGLSFPPIVAGGRHAAILHYTSNEGALAADGLVLFDFGAKWQAMPADISRTFPRSGRFNPLQKSLYELVLSTQAAVEKAAKPGARVMDLNTLAWDHLEKGLKRIIGRSGQVNRPYRHSPHNVGHLIGYQVHDGDAFREYREIPLTPGMAITNEPGLYGTFEAVIDGKQYHETLGIRIEDTLYITKNGCENLTPFPKTISAIEALLNK